MRISSDDLTTAIQLAAERVHNRRLRAVVIFQAAVIAAGVLFYIAGWSR